MTDAPELHPVAVVRRALSGQAGGLPRLFERAVEVLEAEAMATLGDLRARLEFARNGAGCLTPGKERARQSGLAAALGALDAVEGKLRQAQRAREHEAMKHRAAAACDSVKALRPEPPRLGYNPLGEPMLPRHFRLTQGAVDCPGCSSSIALDCDQIVRVDLGASPLAGVATLSTSCPGCKARLDVRVPIEWAT